MPAAMHGNLARSSRQSEQEFARIGVDESDGIVCFPRRAASRPVRAKCARIENDGGKSECAGHVASLFHFGCKGKCRSVQIFVFSLRDARKKRGPVT
jgi:hypothetical protein